MSARSRARKTVVVLAAALVFAVAVQRFLADESPRTAPPHPAPAPASSAGSDRAPLPSTARRSPPQAPARTPDGRPRAGAPPPQASAENRATPGVVDLGALARPPSPPKPEDDAERFATNAWFTHEDLRHPERYFERAEQLPELNRPEERSHTLAFFLAYRQQLERELGAAEGGQRSETLATMQRYDAAIARLRALIQSAATD